MSGSASSVGKKMAKKVADSVIHGKLRMDIPAGQALPGPPLGSQLGLRGINIAAFCKDFNTRTAHYIEGVPLPTRATVNPDRSYNLTIHSPNSLFLIKQAAGITRGAMYPDREVAGWITLKHVYHIANIKAQDPPLELTPFKQICEMVIGAAHSCGVEVKRDYDPAEYAEFLEERKQVVSDQLKELIEKKEAKLLRA